MSGLEGGGSNTPAAYLKGDQGSDGLERGCEMWRTQCPATGLEHGRLQYLYEHAR